MMADGGLEAIMVNTRLVGEALRNFEGSVKRMVLSKLFSPKFGEGSPLLEHHTTSLVFSDPPLHTRVRRILMGALNQRAIARMEAGLADLVDRLLDSLADEPAPDLIEHYAARIPVEVIGNLLAVPHAERGPLRDWSLAILGALEPLLSEEVQARGELAVGEFLDYLRQLVADRRARGRTRRRRGEGRRAGGLGGDEAELGSARFGDHELDQDFEAEGDLIRPGQVLVDQLVEDLPGRLDVGVEATDVGHVDGGGQRGA